jgi:hypothetical protein
MVDGWRTWLTSAGLAAVLAMRWMVPTESAPLGDTLWIAQSTCALGLVIVLASMWNRPRQWNWHFSDLAVSLLVTGSIVATVVLVFQSGDKRSAINAVWEWIGVGVFWFIARRGVVNRRDRVELTAVLLATATILSALGIWQHFVWYPEQIRLYESPRAQLDELHATASTGSLHDAQESQRLEQRLLNLGVPPECLDGPGRKAFESRLLHSREPLANFALTNTLAGLLLPQLLVGWGALGAGMVTRNRWWLVLGGVAAIGFVSYCLLLTKSRTAYAGLLVGLLAWAACRFRQSRAEVDRDPGAGRRNRRAILYGTGSVAAAALILGGLALQTGGLDWLVVAQAPKSLQYRFEYWNGTWDMLRARPTHWLVGVGPGNFRQNYLRFKRPESSEEIADPHQMILDVWANGGLIGLAGLLLLIWTSARLLMRRSADTVQRPDGVQRTYDEEPSASVSPRAGPVIGSSIAITIGLFLTAPRESVALGLVMVWFAALGIWIALLNSSAYERQAATAVGAGILSLMVHLLGAGGIAMPAITLTWLVWLAIGESAVDPDPVVSTVLPSDVPRFRLRTLALVALLAILNAACFISATKPVHARRAWEDSAMASVASDSNLGLAEVRLRNAVAADPWSPDSWQRLADLSFRRWNAQSDSDEAWTAAVEFQREAIARDPRQPGLHRALGRWYLRRFEITRDVQDGAAAERALTAAAELYPNSAAIQADLAEAAAAAGHPDLALQAGQRALGLDMINLQAKHTDKLLDNEQRRRLELMQALPKVQATN